MVELVHPTDLWETLADNRPGPRGLVPIFI